MPREPIDDLDDFVGYEWTEGGRRRPEKQDACGSCCGCLILLAILMAISGWLSGR